MSSAAPVGTWKTVQPVGPSAYSATPTWSPGKSKLRAGPSKSVSGVSWRWSFERGSAISDLTAGLRRRQSLQHAVAGRASAASAGAAGRATLDWRPRHAGAPPRRGQRHGVLRAAFASKRTQFGSKWAFRLAFEMSIMAVAGPAAMVPRARELALVRGSSANRTL